MSMKIQTESGTQYHVTGNKVTRISEQPMLDARDYTDTHDVIIGCELEDMQEPEIGRRWHFKYLTPVTGTLVPISTSPVTRVWE